VPNPSDIGSSEFTSRVRDEDRKTRKPLDWWDRVKLLVLWLGAYALTLWSTIATNPIIPIGDAVYQSTYTMPGLALLVLFVVELIRQLHFVIAEFASGYYLFWKRLFERSDARIMKIKPWTRFRLARVFRWAFLIYVAAAITGSFIGTSAIGAVVEAPQLILQSMPYILQIVFYIFIAIIQFVAIFWFLSRGGIDVYMPDDIRTRFTDVWGQDRVLERIKENILFLENPEAIEARGWHPVVGSAWNRQDVDGRSSRGRNRSSVRVR